ncbi:hypothetical protein Xen7305DRAFT_00049650 [Xenococcus sp. PCC 7305]|uniref:Wadjet anti-phage system protein JetD domain-containing protein n=1 Tax=Xenococcus sp. PCC 7305 TaxID=102125 RepID=UPI0002ACDCE5|nr:Wadjet anti-phage system protein JetD domain-containing protein [Xenococcus sp. PCC 7305]ELS05222.1 hypothetical protein Xen7305DRAFT_00049650 [Xenococcus sp. PCC 7305]
MITPNQIKQKAKRKYTSFLQTIIKNQIFFPLVLPIGKIPQEYIQLRDELTCLINQSKSTLGYGYTVKLTTKNTRSYGSQSLPTKITIETKKDYLVLLNKQSEFSKFKANIELIRVSIPQLEEWIFKHTKQVIDHAGQWEDLLKVCHYFQQNPGPNLYLRELPIEVNTKFIEQNKAIIDSLLSAILPSEVIQPVDKQKKYSFEQKFSLRYEEPLVRFRILDKQLKEKYCFPVFDLTTPLSEFQQLDLKKYHCFITENKMNFLTLPNLQDSFAIWGSGYKTQVLKSVSWLADCPIFYWGDIDADGFKILHQLRIYFPQTISVMMSQDTFNKFEQFSVEVTSSEPENLSNLTKEEYLLYAHVSREGIRLEQEHINQNVAIKHLKECN